MAWCEAHGVDYVLGPATNTVLRADHEIVTAADACATKRAIRQDPVLRNYAQTRYRAKSWKCQCRVVARMEASTLGMDIRCRDLARAGKSTIRSIVPVVRPRT